MRTTNVAEPKRGCSRGNKQRSAAIGHRLICVCTSAAKEANHFKLALLGSNKYRRAAIGHRLISLCVSAAEDAYQFTVILLRNNK